MADLMRAARRVAILALVLQALIGLSACVARTGFVWGQNEVVARASDDSGDGDLAGDSNSGKLDPSFGTAGVFELDLGVYEAVNALAVMADGRIVAAGNASGSGVVMRLLPNGTLDTSFSPSGLPGGTLRWDADGRESPYPRKMLLASDGSLFVAGETGNLDFGLKHVLVDGTPDWEVYQTYQATSDEHNIAGLAFAAGGRLLLGGASSVGAVNFAVLMRRNPTDGSPDLSFGTTGIAAMPFVDIVVLAMALTGDGRILLAGSEGGAFAFLRLNADATPDATFDADGNSDGKIILDFPSVGSAYVYDVAITPEGKILYAGSEVRSTNDELVVGRLLANGAVDVTFGANGVFIMDFSASGNDGASALLVAPDGSIYAAGYAIVAAGHTALALFKLTPGGTLDATFNGTGYALADVDPSGQDQEALCIAQQADGMILVGGRGGLDGDFVVLRYFP